MAELSEEQLLHLVDRAEAGTLLADEAVLLRAGIRSLAAARRSLGGLQAKQQQLRRYAPADDVRAGWTIRLGVAEITVEEVMDHADPLTVAFVYVGGYMLATRDEPVTVIHRT